MTRKKDPHTDLARRTLKPEQREALGFTMGTEYGKPGGFVPDGSELSRRSRPAERDERPSVQHVRAPLTDSIVDAYIDHRGEGGTFILYDQGEPPRGAPRPVPGLRIRIAARSATWSYVSDRLDHGARVATFQKLGAYDRGRVHGG